MLSTSSVPQWRGSLARLRANGCPTLEPVVRGGMPQDAILVLDHNSINEVMASTMEALTGAGFKNLLIVPELALDFFDANAKNSSRVLFNAREAAAQLSEAPSSPLMPKEFINYDGLRQKRDVLLQRDTYRVTVQRVDEYDKALLTELNIAANSYDTRLYVLCALYFKKKLQRPTVMVTSDPVVVEMAEEYGVLTCPSEAICDCGRLIAESAVRAKQAPPPPAPAAAQSAPKGGPAKVGAKPLAQKNAPKGRGKR